MANLHNLRRFPGSLKAHGWAADQIAPIFRSASHSVKQEATLSEGKKRGYLEVLGYLRNAPGPHNSVIDLNITHDHLLSSFKPHTKGNLTHPADSFNPSS